MSRIKTTEKTENGGDNELDLTVGGRPTIERLIQSSIRRGDQAVIARSHRLSITPASVLSV